MARYHCLIAVAAVLAALLTSGCIHLDQVIEIEAGNRGRFSLQASLPVAVWAALVADGDGPLAAYAPAFDPEKGSALFAEADGFVVRKYRVFERDGRKHMQVEGDLTDVRRALASGRLGACRVTSGADRSTIIAFAAGAAPAATDEARRAREDLAAGMRLSLTINVAGEVVTTTAPEHSRRTARWVFDADRDPTFLHQPPVFQLEYR